MAVTIENIKKKLKTIRICKVGLEGTVNKYKELKSIDPTSYHLDVEEELKISLDTDFYFTDIYQTNIIELSGEVIEKINNNIDFISSIPKLKGNLERTEIERAHKKRSRYLEKFKLNENTFFDKSINNKIDLVIQNIQTLRNLTTETSNPEESTENNSKELINLIKYGFNEIKSFYTNININTVLVSIDSYLDSLINEIEKRNRIFFSKNIDVETFTYTKKESKLLKTSNLIKWYKNPKLYRFFFKTLSILSSIVFGIICLIVKDFKFLTWYFIIFSCSLALLCILVIIDFNLYRFVTTKAQIRKILRKVDKEYTVILKNDISGSEYINGYKKYDENDKLLFIKALSWGYLNPKAFITFLNNNLDDSNEINLSIRNIFKDHRIIYKPGINPITKAGFEYMPQKSTVNQIASSRPFTLLAILVTLISFFVVVRNDLVNESKVVIDNFPTKIEVENTQ